MSNTAEPQEPAADGEEIDLDGYDGSELEEIKARMRMMEEEAATLRSLQADAPMRAPPAEAQHAASAGPGGAGGADGAANGEQAAGDAAMQVEGELQEEVDKRSIYVGNVDYSATPTDISNHFQSCGQINRVTIVCDKFSGHPKGFCYIEFADAATVPNAVLLNDSMLCGRNITVTAKRTNIPGFNSRGRGRGRGAYRGGYVRGGFGYSPYSRGRARGRGGWRGAA